jgi:hypothetical protein
MVNMGGEWIEGKSGKTFVVLGTVVREFDGVPLIIYRETRDREGVRIAEPWTLARPLSEWTEPGDLAGTPRFYPRGSVP